MKNPRSNSRTKQAAALALCAVLTFLSAAASAQSISPEPSGLVRQIVAGQTYHARLISYTWAGDIRDLSLFFTLCEQEAFAQEQIESLREGDTIVVSGYPYSVISITGEPGQFIVNRQVESSDTLVFTQRDDGLYTATNEMNHPFWRGPVFIECAVSPSAVLLDWSNPEAEIPVTCTMDDLMDKLIEGEIQLTEDNTEITFDEEGLLCVLLYQITPIS